VQLPKKEPAVRPDGGGLLGVDKLQLSGMVMETWTDALSVPERPGLDAATTQNAQISSAPKAAVRI